MTLISIFTFIFIHLHPFQSNFFQFYPNSSKVALMYPLNMMCVNLPLFILIVISNIHDPLKFLNILKTLFKIPQFSSCFIQFHPLQIFSNSNPFPPWSIFLDCESILVVENARVAPEYCAYKKVLYQFLVCWIANPWRF